MSTTTTNTTASQSRRKRPAKSSLPNTIACFKIWREELINTLAGKGRLRDHLIK